MNMNVLKPLFRDPIYDGATDPMVIYNEGEGNWWMFYTQRRVNFPSRGVSGVYGSKIGIAVSDDGGNYWYYRGALDLEFEFGHNTFWAPEIIFHEGVYHMYVSYIRGIHHIWKGDRSILHYASVDLQNWELQAPIDLGSSRIIDACIFRLKSGDFRMWFKDESKDSHTVYADSSDLYHWYVKGKAIYDCAHEGPNVFYLKGRYYMIVDCWDGQGVYSSEDLTNWKRQKNNILKEPGMGAMDGSKGLHGDVVVTKDNAYIFYFTHPHRREKVEKIDKDEDVPVKYCVTAIQVAELEVDINGDIVCNRDKVLKLNLNANI